MLAMRCRHVSVMLESFTDCTAQCDSLSGNNGEPFSQSVVAYCWDMAQQAGFSNL